MNRPHTPTTPSALAVTTRLGTGAALGALSQLSALMLLAVSAYLISRAWQQPPILYLMVAITSVRMFGIARGVLRYAERLVSHDAAFRDLERRRVGIYTALTRLAPAGLPVWRSGDLQARLVDDVDGSGDRWLRGALPLIQAAAVAAVAVALQAGLLPAAGAILAATLLLAALGGPALAAWASRMELAATARARADLTAGVQSCLLGREELVAAGADALAVARALDADERLRRGHARIAWTAGLGQALGLTAMAAAVIGSAWTGAAAVAAGTLDGVLLAVVVLVPLAAFEPVLALPQAFQQWTAARASERRLTEITGADEPRPDPAQPAEPSTGPALIEAEGLTVAWPGTDRPALTGLDLRLAPGEHVGLVGPSGAGKSTLAAALMGFLPYSGSLRLGGVEYADLTGDAVRERVGLCSQLAHVFDTTLAENLRLAAPGSDDADLERALRLAGLETWLDGLADGLDTRLGEHGRAVSGGERGRIALARCLLADRDVVILDEPDAHLDTARAESVLRAAAAALHGRTAVFITHRPLPDDLVDRVVHIAPGTATRRDEPDNRLVDAAPAV